jgi:hypothetical protein
MEKSMAQKLKELLESTSQADFDREWAEIEMLGYGGPTVDEFLLAQTIKPVITEVNPNIIFNSEPVEFINNSGEENYALAA